MAPLGDRFNKMVGKTRFVVCRLFLHLAGSEVAPLLGTLNQAARTVIEAGDGDLDVMGEQLVDICQQLLQYDAYWMSAANEGDFVWDEAEAGDYFTELFTDSASRYLAEPELSTEEDDSFSVPITQNIIVMITLAAEGEVPELETSLADAVAMVDGLKAIINLHYQQRLRGIQVHYSPAKLGDELTNDQLLQNFPELIPF
ncbi:MAG: DUF1517 domain-containing protein [Microcoleaceae cyanobacterium]